MPDRERDHTLFMFEDRMGERSLLKLFKQPFIQRIGVGVSMDVLLNGSSYFAARP